VDVVRSLVLVFVSVAFAAYAVEQRSPRDPEFEKFPFDQWLGEKDQTHIKWKAGLAHAVLSFHQRLVSQVEMEVDGKDLESRRNDGKLTFLVQITNHEGVRYQNHSDVELGKLDQNIKAANLEYSQRVFFLPGEYQLAVAIVDRATGEHSVRQSKFRIVAAENELLTLAWRDLPPVEFLGKPETPDGWFLPDILGRLQWATPVHSPARINVLLNVAPSALQPEAWRPISLSRGMGRYGQGPFGTEPNGTGPVRDHSGTSEEMGALIPTLKALTETGSPAITENVALLDLARRRTVFEQSDVKDLDWPRLKSSLGQATTASIDVHSLSERHHDAQYFISEVRRVIRASEHGCVLVVLTNPVSFESGEDKEPISTEALPACHVFYIRYRPPNPAMYNAGPQPMSGRGRGGLGGGPMMRTVPHEAVDQLEGTLKPLNPKVYDATTPEQINKAFVDIEKLLTQ
jgi:hypothetical protein